MLTPAEKSLRGAIGANISWSRTEDRAARTSNGRRAFDRRFEDQVDPDRKLSHAERAKRAESARRAYFQQLALKSAKSRRRAKEARAEAVLLDRVADAADAELVGGA